MNKLVVFISKADLNAINTNGQYASKVWKMIAAGCIARPNNVTHGIHFLVDTMDETMVATPRRKVWFVGAINVTKIFDECYACRLVSMPTYCIHSNVMHVEQIANSFRMETGHLDLNACLYGKHDFQTITLDIS